MQSKQLVSLDDICRDHPEMTRSNGVSNLPSLDMTSTAIRQTPWFQSRKWFTEIHFDQENLKEVSGTICKVSAIPDAV